MNTENVSTRKLSCDVTIDLKDSEMESTQVPVPQEQMNVNVVQGLERWLCGKSTSCSRRAHGVPAPSIHMVTHTHL